jgi:glycerophosphoryl diester phosphodiesterase
MKRSILNIGHRGASGSFPENTIAAFRAAIDAGAQMCELDVQLTRDRAIVVIHDETVDRTTDGRGAVAEMTLAELKLLDAGARFQGGARVHGERIPTLDEVFAATTGKCGLNIELKAKGLELEVVESIRNWNALETSMVSSFEWDALEVLRKIDTEVRIGVLAESEVPAMLETAARLDAYAVNPHYDMVTAELCDNAHARSLKVLTWTVDEPAQMHLLIDHGVDGIMTNYPARLRDVLGA